MRDALENGVSTYPKYDGRFPLLSGVKFSFNPDLPPLSRIKTEDIFVNGERLQLDKTYKAAIKGFLIEGKDGYEAFKDGFENIILDKEGYCRITDLGVARYWKS